MENLEIAPELHNNAAPIVDYYTRLLDRPMGDDIDELRDSAEEVWAAHQRFELTQTNPSGEGNITGTFDRDAIAIWAGSLAGLSIYIDIQTETGVKNVQLRLNGQNPAFDIKPVNHEDALTITPLQPNYAQLPIDEAFDWDSIVGQAHQRRGPSSAAAYLVVFRSELKDDADRQALQDHDRRAHIAAQESPALIYYFGGTPDSFGRALSFCLWENADAAREISKDRRHTEATKMVSSYKDYSIEKYDVLHELGKTVLIPRGDSSVQ